VLRASRDNKIARSAVFRRADRRLSGGATELNPGLIFARRANVQGISVGSTQMFMAMNRAIEVGASKPVIDKVCGFDDAPAAYRHMASGAHFGKIVIRVG
jgi:NADPH:quinone reductase-like Zn-dependent oxidoreductase